MAARSLAFFFLLAGTTAALAGPLSPELQPPTVGVMLKFDRKPAHAFLKHLQAEVGAIFQPAGLDLRWEILGDKKTPGTYNRVVVVEMHGRCEPVEAAVTPSGSDRLGWTNLSDGEVLPYAALDCDQIARVVASARGPLLKRQLWPTLYVRLASRVLAHELLHALLQTSDHHETDCARSTVRSADLGYRPQLDPTEIAALRQIGRVSRVTIARKD